MNPMRGTQQRTDHHVPPRSVGARFVLRKKWRQHAAYHALFGNAPTLEACVEILRKQWWTPPKRKKR